MIRRSGLLLAMAGALLLAGSGVVPAEPTRAVPPDHEFSPNKDDEFLPDTADSEGFIPDHYIVVFNDDKDVEAARATSEQAVRSAKSVARELARRHGLRVTHVYEYALKGFAAEIPAESLSGVRSDPRVKGVAQDRKIEVRGQTVPTGIKRIGADRSNRPAGGSGEAVDVDVAIIDTGISRHLDLNVVGGYNCTSNKPTDWSDRFPRGGHGTHVAGTVAAKDDSVGVVGVAPGARLWAVKAGNSIGSTSAWEICGINWVTAHNSTIEVANMSLGRRVGPGVDDGDCGRSDPVDEDYVEYQAEHQAICNSVDAGVTYVVAAGQPDPDEIKAGHRDGHDASEDVPAAFDEVITVSALADYDGEPGGLGARKTCGRRDSDAATDDTFPTFSNFGPDVDLAAPGVCINSTTTGGKYAPFTGTSMAAPHVAGAAALHKAKNPTATPAQVKAALVSSAEALGDGHTDPSGLHPEPVLLLHKSKIAFARWAGEGGNGDIWTTNPNGTNTGRIGGERWVLDFSPSFSPDGKEIVFVRGTGFVSDSGIWVMKTSSGGMTQLTKALGHDEPVFSPDGKKIAFQGSFFNAGTLLLVMNADGTGIQLLRNDEFCFEPGRIPNSQSDDRSPSFSPDGKKIAFSRVLPGEDCDTTRDDSRFIFVMNADGTGIQQLTSGPGYDFRPSFSPDGKKIAFSRLDDSDDRGLAIYVMNADGSGERQLTDSERYLSPSFSPDGKKIAFERDCEIWVMNANGTEQKPLISRHSDWECARSPDWGPVMASP